MIDRKTFDEGSFKTYRGNTVKVLEFLKNNKDNAYTSKEIATELNISLGSASVTLRNLVKAEAVEIKKPYYILKSTSSSAKKKSKKNEEEAEIEGEE